MSGLPDKVREFLEEIAGPDDIETLRRNAALWDNSADMNEEYLAKTALQARELLIEFGGDA